MEKFILLFEEFLMKAITMTENILSQEFSAEVNFDGFTNNRERLLAVLDQISQQIEWQNVADEKRSELNRRIDYMKKLDEKLLVRLQEYQQEIKQEIETTVRQKDNIKGYNLNDVK